LVLVAVDLYVYHAPWNAVVEAQVWSEPPATAQAVRERAGPALYRIFSYHVYSTFRAAYRQAGGWRGDLGPYVAQREFLQPSLNLIYDVPAADGYVNLVPDCLVALWGNEKQAGLMDVALAEQGERLLARAGFVKLLSLYNVRFLITSRPVQDEALELLGVYDSGAHLYENHQAMPRAFAVPHHTVISDVQAGLDWMRAPAFDPATTVVLLEPPDALALDQASPAPASLAAQGAEEAGFTAQVEVVSYEAQRVIVEAELSAPGWLVLSDTYYSGWEATVDGRSTPVYQANGCVRAVSVPRGQHKVVFRFRPRSFYRGALISSVSAVSWVVIWLAFRARRVARI
jgi:hypothetical protein